jgi:hypothetical protein
LVFHRIRNNAGGFYLLLFKTVKTHKMSYQKVTDYRGEELVTIEATEKFDKNDPKAAGKLHEVARSMAKLLVESGKAKYTKKQTA